jgi:His-Xaa-Ser system protein HxsD
MSDPVDGLPPEAVTIERGAVRIALDDSLYPLEALYGAGYIFIDRCFVLLDRPQPGRWLATLTPKSGDGDAAALRALAGEFANELLSCAWRYQITQANRAQIVQVTTQAIAGAVGEPSLEELEKFDFSGDAFDDPLGIAVTWEEKQRRKKESEP